MSLPGFTADAALGDRMQTVVPQINPICLLECGAALIKCLGSDNKIQCLIDAGMGKCVQCLM